MADKTNNPKKNWFARHKVASAILGIILIAIIAGAAGGGSKSDTTTGDKVKTDNKATVTIAKVGEPARDGQFEFVIKSVTCGKPSVTDSSGYVTKTAHGQYCLMDITVKNIGDKAQYLLESDQKLLNSAGLQYSPDSTATLTHSNNSDALIAQVNPGNTVQGVLVFDIPKDQTPMTAELHDSSLSNGIKVTLQ